MRVMVIFIALATASPVWAQTADGAWWGFGPGVMNRMDLTTEQMAQIRDITSKWLEALQPIWTELQKKNSELDQLMWAANPDSVEVEAKSKEIGNLEAQIRKRAVERQKAVREVLTDEQKTLFDRQGPGAGWARSPCGLGLGRGMGGRAGGFYRGRGRGGWGGRLDGGMGTWGLTDSPGTANWSLYGRGPGRLWGNRLGRRRW